jgi:alkylhydroperoxidase family enzyme
MARVRLNTTTDLPEDFRWLFERMEARGGLLNIFRALSHSPEALRRFMKFGSYLLEEGKLHPKLREISILRAGAVCRSPYEFGQHIAFARRSGLDDAAIRATLTGDGSALDSRGRAVLTYAGELSAASRVSDATFAAVREFLDEEEIVELTIVVGFYNMVSRLLNALDVDVDPPARHDLAQLEVRLD